MKRQIFFFFLVFATPTMRTMYRLNPLNEAIAEITDTLLQERRLKLEDSRTLDDYGIAPSITLRYFLTPLTKSEERALLKKRDAARQTDEKDWEAEFHYRANQKNKEIMALIQQAREYNLEALCTLSEYCLEGYNYFPVNNEYALRLADAAMSRGSYLGRTLIAYVYSKKGASFINSAFELMREQGKPDKKSPEYDSFVRITHNLDSTMAQLPHWQKRYENFERSRLQELEQQVQEQKLELASQEKEIEVLKRRLTQPSA